LIKNIFGQEVNLEKIKNKRIKIDVGCDMAAPHSARWLHDDEECFVIAVEPNVFNLNYLKDGSAGNGMRDLSSFDGNGFYLKTSSNSIMRDNEEIKTYKKENLLLLPIAIDNVGNNIVKKTFFSFEGISSGCSSLCEPSDEFLKEFDQKYGEKLKTYDVDCCSLEYILDLLGLQDISQIDILKTDCQGRDLQVIKSLGKYLTRLNILKCEWNTKAQYKDSYTKSDIFSIEEIIKFENEVAKMTNLHSFFRTETDSYFINLENEKIAKDFQHMRKTLSTINSNNPSIIKNSVINFLINAPNQSFNDLKVLHIL
tara:strand:- start:467 stop:1402 length:936 start_codon:yes stop_codon:yes gene_type:complete